MRRGTYGTSQTQSPAAEGVVVFIVTGTGARYFLTAAELYEFGSVLVMMLPLTVVQFDSNVTVSGSAVEFMFLVFHEQKNK
jgi:hypothetical protein